MDAPETAPRVVSAGPPVGGLPPGARRTVVAIDTGVAWLVEGVIGDDELSYAASISLGPHGRVTRHLEFRTGSHVPWATGIGGHADHDAAAVLERYLTHLDAGAFHDAAACFSPDVLYSHPPYQHTGISDPRRLDIVGRPALMETFRRRGRQSFGHRVIAFGQDGPHAMLEGVVEGLPDGGNGSFLSSLSLDAAGLISRYVSFYCEPAVEA